MGLDAYTIQVVGPLIIVYMWDHALCRVRDYRLHDNRPDTQALLIGVEGVGGERGSRGPGAGFDVWEVVASIQFAG